MNPLHDHERALLLVLGEDASPAAAFEALLAHPDVVAYQLPPPWFAERVGMDLSYVLPDLPTLRREDLPRVLEALVRLHDADTRDAYVQRTWREADERIRSFYLARPTLQAMAAVFRMAPRTADYPPPPEFVEAQVVLHRFEMEYRLRRETEAPSDRRAPVEEGSLILYPFDPPNAVARREAELGEGRGPVLECFTYAPERARHRAVLEDVAHGRGWRVIDSAG